MLKRYQVLLEDWLADFAKEQAETHDTSFSEVVRVALCVYYGIMVSHIYPEYDFRYTPDKIISEMKKHLDDRNVGEIKDKMTSEIYYETRKALDYFKEKRVSGTTLP